MTRQGALAPVLCRTVPVACPWLERTFCVCGCACKMDAAGGAFAYSVQNKCLVNRYSLSNRKGHGHFPLPPLCHDVLPFQAAFSGFQQAEQLAAVRAAPSIRAAARTCPCSYPALILRQSSLSCRQQMLSLGGIAVRGSSICKKCRLN